MDSPTRQGYVLHMRMLFSLLLALILALASQAEAVARSEMAGATDQTLCSTLGTASVTLDATGHRIAPHSCTHCTAASVMGDLAAPNGLTAAPLTAGRTATPVPTSQTPTRQTFAPSARAPPAILV